MYVSVKLLLGPGWESPGPWWVDEPVPVRFTIIMRGNHKQHLPPFACLNSKKQHPVAAHKDAVNDVDYLRIYIKRNSWKLTSSALYYIFLKSNLFIMFCKTNTSKWHLKFKRLFLLVYPSPVSCLIHYMLISLWNCIRILLHVDSDPNNMWH